MFRRTYRIAMVAALAMTLAVVTALGISAQRPEGIEVHGHWKIEILDEDGSLVRTSEFENDLAAGANNLAALLGRTNSQGLWSILAVGVTAPCSDGGCNIREPAGAVGGNTESNDLAVSVNAGALVLSGSFVADRDGDIGNVSTQAGLCVASIAPDSCTAGGVGNFSQRPGLNEVVVSGQIVQITVTFTFS